jgi:CheY-like chemotaxis protein
MAEPLTGIRVLVVDDNDDNRFIISESLRFHGAFVEAVSAARDAAKMLDGFNIVVTDYAMPDRDGIWLLEQAQQRARPVPVILLSAFTEPARRPRDGTVRAEVAQALRSREPRHRDPQDPEPSLGPAVTLRARLLRLAGIRPRLCEAANVRAGTASQGPGQSAPICSLGSLIELPGTRLAFDNRMHLVAREDPRSRQWRWEILDPEGAVVAASSTQYSSVGEALETGRTQFLRLVREHPPRRARPRGFHRRGAA